MALCADVQVKGTVEDLKKSSSAAAPQGKAAISEQAAADHGAPAGPGSSTEDFPGASGPKTASAAEQQDTQGCGSGGAAQQGAAEGSESKTAGEEKNGDNPKAEARGFMARLQSMAETVRKEVGALVWE